MRIRNFLAIAVLSGAVGLTSFLGALSASKAYAAGAAGSTTVFEPIPTFVYGFENPLVPAYPALPVLGR